MGSAPSTNRCGFVKGMAAEGHIHAHIEQDVEGNGYTWSVSTAGDIWMGVAQDAQSARAVVDLHIKGIIKSRWGRKG